VSAGGQLWIPEKSQQLDIAFRERKAKGKSLPGATDQSINQSIRWLTESERMAFKVSTASFLLE
jgi:hypothetical protein